MTFSVVKKKQVYSPINLLFLICRLRAEAMAMEYTHTEVSYFR